MKPLPNDAPFEFEVINGQPCLNGQVIEPGDRLYGGKFGIEDPAERLAMVKHKCLQLVDATKPGPVEAATGFSPLEIGLAAALLVALVWLRRK